MSKKYRVRGRRLHLSRRLKGVGLKEDVPVCPVCIGSLFEFVDTFLLTDKIPESDVDKFFDVLQNMPVITRTHKLSVLYPTFIEEKQRTECPNCGYMREK